MPAGLALLVLAVVLSVGGGLVCYALVRDEHDQRPFVGRDEAERLARRDEPDREP